MQRMRSWKAAAATVVVASVAYSVHSPADRADKAGATKATATDLAALAEEAYIYGYPLVLMDATKRQETNVATAQNMRAPVNQFARLDTLPDANFKAVVRPNVDTLYTSAFLDLAKEPIVLHVPDTKGRYYLMPMLDAYTNVFAAPGKRTTGTKEQNIAIVGPGWKGKLPKGVTQVQAPTNMVWLLGRTMIDGKEDLENVVELTSKYSLTPLSAYGTSYTPPKNQNLDPSLDVQTKPPKLVEDMDAQAYFERLAQLMKENPPPARDRKALARFERIGLAPGRFEPSAEAQKAIEGAPQRALERIAANVKTFGTHKNGWSFATDLGSYDTNYLLRATIALAGLGANLAKDAVYPAAFTDGKGQPLSGDKQYVLHFAKGKEPPVNAFWSLTMYGPDGYFVANPIERYAIGDRDKLVRNPDGSLDILIQNKQPSGDLAANWLPAPEGPFNVMLRMYWPKDPVIKGTWTLPPVTERQAPTQVGRAAPSGTPREVERK